MYKYRILEDQAEYKAGQILTQEEFKELINKYGIFQHIERIYVSEHTGWIGNAEDCLLNFGALDNRIKDQDEVNRQQAQRIQELEAMLVGVVNATKSFTAGSQQVATQDEVVLVSIEESLNQPTYEDRLSDTVLENTEINTTIN